MKNITLLILLFISINIYAQDTLYLDSNGIEVTANDPYKEFKIAFPASKDPDEQAVLIKVFNAEGIQTKELNYSNYKRKQFNGKQIYYYDSGELYYSQEYDSGRYEGELLVFYKTGVKKRVDVFSQDQFVSGTCWDENGAEITHFDFFINAEYPGGSSEMYKFLGQNMKYPSEARDNNYQGRVFVSFVVEKDGSLTDIKILKSPHELLSTEALRVVKAMPKWTPGEVDGEKVRMRFNLPIVFKLNNVKSTKKRKKKKRSKN